ncbi:MAG: decaprenyl-phosphate phosphoribosyltransferase [Pelosinus sp.]|nr:decaprenyl-phosphate phosphoribosyltransferase [Pelosinus sp.]
MLDTEAGNALKQPNSLLKSTTLSSQIRPFIQCLRPKQWTKNLIVLAAAIFSINIITLPQIGIAFLAFALFCLMSGCVYVLNDFMDRERDKVHPEKCKRPIASGQLNLPTAIIAGSLLFLLTTGSAFCINPFFAYLLLIYFAINIAYSLYLKHIVILDVMIIAAGFVLRAIGGGIAIHVPVTPWFILCTLLLSLFLAIGKRRNEVFMLEDKGESHRKVLRRYSLPLLDQLTSIVTTATIMSYALYTFTSGKPVEMMCTIPLVIYGMFRYLYLIHIEKKGGAPEKILLHDKPILYTVILYLALVIAILYFCS